MSPQNGWRLPVVSMVVVAVCLLAGCGGADNEEGETSEISPEQACRDTAEAVAELAERCGQDYEETRTQFISNAAGGDCGNIVGVRDEAALYDECIPWWGDVSCEEYEEMSNEDIPRVCRDQLHHPQNSQN